jgi:small subunit ribosomal protein S16
MVRIRLRRVGRKKQASFRLVAAEKESPRDGRYIEILGFYNPRTEPATIEIKEDRIYEWMSKGAQPSDSVVKILTVAGTLERYERFKKGEDVAKLVEEAKAAEDKRSPSPKTRYAAPEKSTRKPAKAEAEAPAAAPVEEPKAEEKEVEEPKAEEVKEEEAPAEEPKAEETAEEPEAKEEKAEEPKAEEAEEEPEAEAEEKVEEKAEEKSAPKKKPAAKKEEKPEAEKKPAAKQKKEEESEE